MRILWPPRTTKDKTPSSLRITDIDIEPNTKKRGFLSLPAELRINVYRFISPIDMEFSYLNFQGLYLSCKTIRHEMDVECSKHFKKELDRIPAYRRVTLVKAEYHNGAQHMPSANTFPQLNNIKLNIYVDVAAYELHTLPASLY